MDSMWCITLTILVVCRLASGHNTNALEHLSPAQNAPVHCKRDERCVALVQCPSHVYDGAQRPCGLSTHRPGICCRSGQNHTGAEFLRAMKNHEKIPNHVVKEAATASNVELNVLDQELLLLSSGGGFVLSQGTPSYGHFRHNRISSPEETERILATFRSALNSTFATKHLKEKQRLSNAQIELNTFQAHGGSCLPEPVCPAHLIAFRTFDGTCNNRRHAAYGAILTPFSRLLPPSYSDGIWVPRVSKVHGPLPSARSVSNAVISDVDRPDYEHTLLLMQFGQFLAHDFSRIVDAKYANGSGISCCDDRSKNELPPQLRHFACMPIIVTQDSFYNKYEQGCMNFVRSLLAPHHDCRFGYAQQMNRVTHFLDGSAIYGTTRETTDDIREYTAGRLRMFHDFGRDLLPLTKDAADCRTAEQGAACFLTGDTRCNVMITLIAVHTVFAREHNRVAKALAALNPHWNDERLFQEARKIVVAQLQHITYSEWLPQVVGRAAVQEFQLDVVTNLYSGLYDPLMDPSITNEFTTAAFRFGHSTVDGKLKLYGSHKMDEIIDIPELFFYPSRMRRAEVYDEALNTLTTERMQMADTSFTEGLTKYLFRAGGPFGLDLAAVNIQRGRDHGLRPYNDYRKLIGLPPVASFHDFGPEMGDALSKVYASVDDIDLYIGGLTEAPVPGGIVGQTFRDIIADQFNRLRRGDRYFYDLDASINPGHFKPEQLREIKKTSMSRLICDNNDGNLVRQAPNAFRMPGLLGNDLHDCNGPFIPRMNLMHWREW